MDEFLGTDPVEVESSADKATETKYAHHEVVNSTPQIISERDICSRHATCDTFLVDFITLCRYSDNDALHFHYDGHMIVQYTA